jgi:hypothetical protein
MSHKLGWLDNEFSLGQMALSEQMVLSLLMMLGARFSNRAMLSSAMCFRSL